VTCLVLGGSVFVGRHLVTTLTGRGHHVAVLNRGRTPARLPEGVEHLIADRSDPTSMSAALSGRTWDAVFDVSGFVMAAGGSDLDGLLASLDGRTGSYVYVSSIMAYDQALTGLFPWTEDLATDPSGPASYGGFKAATEAKLMERHRARGFPATVVRPAAVYGPDNNIYDMETAMFLRLHQRRPVLLPHGGMVLGSYGHVDDLAEAMSDLAFDETAAGEILNISDGAVSALRYAQELAAIVGVEPNLVFVPDELIPGPEEPPVFGHLFSARHHATISSARASAAFGLRPRHDFRSGHEATYEWFCAQGWSDLREALVDPAWGATWDFEAEATLATRITANS
jgi:nucleoside-diphosphate-sugar epimerase